MTKLPYLPLFFGDFLTSTYTWRGEQQSLYLLLLAYQWVSGPLPLDLDELADAARYDHKRFVQLWAKVGTKFVKTDEGWINLRLEEHREKANLISEKRAKSGAKGGRPRKQPPVRLIKQEESKQKANGFGLVEQAAIQNDKQAENYPTQPNLREEVRGYSGGKV